MIRRQGPFNKKVLYFDGVDDYVSISRSDSLNVTEITMEVLVKPMKLPDGEHPVFDRNNYYAIGFYREYFWSWLRLPTRSRMSSRLSVNKIWHLVVTFCNGVRRHYVNGMLDSEWYEGENKIEIYNSLRLIIGANANDTTDTYISPGPFFNGIIYIVRIWNRALSDVEIKRVYHEAFLMKPTSVRDGLVLELLPDTIDWENRVWRDNSGHGNDGTIYGCKLVYV